MAPPSTAAPRASITAPLMAALLFAYFGTWALLRPPLQTPDEPQHLLKATSILRQPWVGPRDRFELDAAHVNPLALETPPSLDKLFFHRVNALTAQDIVLAKQPGWYDATRALPPYERAIASYPTPYYLALFAVAEPVTSLLELTPYQATYAYRLVSSALAAVLWAIVWAVLVRTMEPGPLAGFTFAVAVLNPMLAYMSSAVNPDAVNNPLCALALLLAWRVAAPQPSSETGPETGPETGLGTSPRGGPGGIAGAFLVLVLAMLTKPSGLQLVPTLAVVLGALSAARRIEPRRALLAIGLAVAAATTATLVFYLWSPPRFMAGGPSQDSVRQFLAYHAADAGRMWRMYWGELGWLDYQAGAVWYWLVGLMVAVNLACLGVRPRPCHTIGWYLGLSWIVFALVTFAGEYWYLAQAGYTFQGRYLFPAALGAGALFCHHVPFARSGLVAAIAALTLALVHETVVRYYVDRWTGLWQSLPF